MCSYMIYFELLFVYGIRCGLKLFFHTDWKIILSPLKCLCIFMENQLAIHKPLYFWYLLYSMNLYMYLFISFTSLKIRLCESSKFVLLLNYFGFLVPLHFHMDLQSAYLFWKKMSWDFIGNASNLEKFCITTFLSFPTINMTLSFRSSLISFNRGL